MSAKCGHCEMPAAYGRLFLGTDKILTCDECDDYHKDMNLYIPGSDWTRLTGDYE